jgi:hypothetical protein
MIQNSVTARHLTGSNPRAAKKLLLPSALVICPVVEQKEAVQQGVYGLKRSSLDA